MTLLQNMIDSAAEISYKIHMTIGFVFGIFSSLLSGRIEDFAITFFLGASSALGAGLVKYIMDRLKERKTKVSIRDLVRKELEEYNDENK